MTMTAVKFSETPSVRRYWPEALILLVAALVRCWRLDYHSFWFDETVSLDWAEDGAGYIWQSTFTLLKDKHPPGYYLLLHAWQNLLEVFGLQHNDVALRALGAALGVLTVLGLLLLVRRLSGRPVALLAGTLAGAGAGAGLVQPGAAHVSAGDDGAGVGRILPAARLARRNTPVKAGLVAGHGRGLHLCAVQLLLQRAGAARRRVEPGCSLGGARLEIKE